MYGLVEPSLEWWQDPSKHRPGSEYEDYCPDPYLSAESKTRGEENGLIPHRAWRRCTP